MKAIIKLDVPEWQIGQDVSVYFPDTMLKHGECELLKEQEAVSIKWKYGFPHCPVCGQMLPEGDAVKYCLHCGQAVKWE